MNVQLAAIQMVSGPRLQDNLDQADALVAAAAAGGAALAVLPEYFCLMGLQPTDKLDVMESPGGPIESFLAGCARRHRIALVGGTLPRRAPRAGRVLNTCIVFDAAGQRLAHYDKIHLFGLNRGDERFDEAATIVAGRTPVVCDVPLDGGARLRLGLSICYDLRFPELYRRMAPVDVIVAPSAFTHTTGSAHWALLCRTRALENQCYLIAAAQGGTHPGGRRTWGHSMIVDPWGDVLAERADDGAGCIAAAFDGQRLADVRRALPALAHRVL